MTEYKMKQIQGDSELRYKMLDSGEGTISFGILVVWTRNLIGFWVELDLAQVWTFQFTNYAKYLRWAQPA